MYNLSQRLKTVASFVPQGKSVCDVGTDHAYLPAALYLEGKCKSVTATDIKEKPLKNARKNLDKLGIDGVKLVLCNGLSAVEYKDAEVVIIAGMGGDVISKIIDDCPYKKLSAFILQPMTASVALREYLAQNGFCVNDEVAVCENGKIYSVMAVNYDGVKRNLTNTQKKIGMLKPITSENIQYIKKQYNIANKCAADLTGVSGKEELQKENELLAQELAFILEG